jgi:two-component system chemotaxis sensor kinase CheA
MKINEEISQDELKVFLEETEEQIELLDNDIVRMEKEPDNDELIQEIFRAAHTVKGSSAMVGYTRMAELTHAMENLLDKLRNKQLALSSEIVNDLLSGLDALKILKQDIHSDEESDVDTESIIERLQSHTNSTQPVAKEEKHNIITENLQLINTSLVNGETVYHIKTAVSKDSPWGAVRFILALNEMERMGKVLVSMPSSTEIEQGKVGSELEIIFSGEVDADNIQGVLSSIDEIVATVITHLTEDKLASMSFIKSSTAADRVENIPQNGKNHSDEKSNIGKSKEAGDSADAQTLQSVRIDVKILDDLMNIVEELVIDRSRINRLGKMLAAKYEDDDTIEELSLTSGHIIKIINELQESIMKVRMIPISAIFSRFPRLVRDLAQKQGKELDFIVEGNETELDRSIVEKIRDPLIHLLRNAVDHGVELPADRIKAAKPVPATVKLSAFQEQGHICIILEDDGKGIDPEKLKRKAVEKGFINEEAAASLSKNDAINLIFLPGFSTAEKTTEVSGRGVGMDIVRTNIENLGGSIAIESNVGAGTKFILRLPLTVAIVQGLLIASGSTTYIMPLASVLETIKVDREDIQTINKNPVIRLRNSIVPIVNLENLLNRRKWDNHLNDQNLIVIIGNGANLTGLVVDDLMERQEIVVKPLGKYMEDIEGISGGTILGDGNVALILDALSLSKMMQEQAVAV